MKLKLNLGSITELVELKRDGEQLVVEYAGTTISLSRIHSDKQRHLFEYVDPHTGQKQRLHIAGTPLDKIRRQLWVNGQTFLYERLPNHSHQPSESQNDASLAASIPAIVSKILVNVGDTVQSGDKLILLESMKMVIPIQAPYNGVVVAIHCAVGQAIQPGINLIALSEQ